MRRNLLHLLVLTALILMFTASGLMPAYSAEKVVSFELETYVSPDNQLSMGIPVGWTEKQLDSFLISKTKDNVSFAIMRINQGAKDSSPMDFLNALIVEMKSDESYPDMRITQTPALDTSSSTPIAHARLAFKKNDKPLTSDQYVVADNDGNARYVFMTYVPAAEQDDYRSLFDAMVHSIRISKSSASIKALSSALAANVTLEAYKDPESRFTIDLPKGWETIKSEDMLVFLRNDSASIGVFSVDEDSRADTPAIYLPFLIEELKTQKIFKDLRVIQETDVLTQTRFNTAWSKIAYKMDGGPDYVSYLYIIAGSDGKPVYGIATYIPADLDDKYKSAFDTIARSIVVGAVNTGDASVVKPADKDVEIEVKKVDDAKSKPVESKPIPLNPIYWIRNGAEILKDGKVILTDSSGDIGRACISPDGKTLAYSRGKSDIILVNLSTGKRTKVYGAKSGVILPGTDAAELTSIWPVGFSPDAKILYVFSKQHSVFVGGNKLYSLTLQTSKAKVVDVGLNDAAVSRTGDLLILKPGTVQFVGKGGTVWQVEPSIRSLFINGVGFNQDSRPFYYSEDSIYYISKTGDEKRIDINGRIDSRPVTAGETIVFDDGKQLKWNKEGPVMNVVLTGKNTNPFK